PALRAGKWSRVPHALRALPWAENSYAFGVEHTCAVIRPQRSDECAGGICDNLSWIVKFSSIRATSMIREENATAILFPEESTRRKTAAKPSTDGAHGPSEARSTNGVNGPSTAIAVNKRR